MPIWFGLMGSWQLVIVQRESSGSFCKLGACVLEDYAGLQNVQHPVSTIVALYVLTGCDYVSPFFKHTKKDMQYLLTTNSIISFVEDGNGHKVFEGILTDMWVNLVC